MRRHLLARPFLLVHRGKCIGSEAKYTQSARYDIRLEGWFADNTELAGPQDVHVPERGDTTSALDPGIAEEDLRAVNAVDEREQCLCLQALERGSYERELARCGHELCVRPPGPIAWHGKLSFRALVKKAGSCTQPTSFAREIDDDDWDRFDRYSAKVHNLRFDGVYRPSVFNQLALGRRQLDFLPNLVTLYDPEPTPLFTYSNIKRLVFRWSGRGASISVTSWLRLVSRRMPHLESLLCPCIDDNDAPDLPSALTSALQQSKHLKELTIPAGCLNGQNLLLLAGIPTLESITINSPFPMSTSHPIISNFPDNPFPSLKVFSVHMYFRTAGMFVPSINAGRALRTFRILSPYSESFLGYMELLKAIACHCPHLEVLELKKKSERQADTTHSYTTEFNPWLSHILQSLSHLTSLALRHFGMQGLFPLRDLPVFAVHCKGLSYLQLDIDTNCPLNDVAFYEFPKLKTLDVGLSPISEPTKVASFLSCVLPCDCEISDEYDPSEPCEAAKHWGAVSNWAPVLVNARMEGRPTGRAGISL
ncbi:hypothetical protein EYR40_009146 [Pleurotus pulmonarius]|nr:hypothetical protein EYR40_009146 [Pleurotus pulmonarius]